MLGLIVLKSKSTELCSNEAMGDYGLAFCDRLNADSHTSEY